MLVRLHPENNVAEEVYKLYYQHYKGGDAYWAAQAVVGDESMTWCVCFFYQFF